MHAHDEVFFLHGRHFPVQAVGKGRLQGGVRIQVRDLLDMAEQPNLQIVATAHSPFVLDSLEATEVFVAGSAPAGGVSIGWIFKHIG